MAAGSDMITGPDGAQKISESPRDYFAPDAAGLIRQGSARFPLFRAHDPNDG